MSDGHRFGRSTGRVSCKRTELKRCSMIEMRWNKWSGAGVVISLKQGADLHMVQLMPLPFTVSCFSEIQIGFTFLVPAHPGSHGKRAVKRVHVRVTWR